MIEVGKQREYIEAVREDYANADRETMVRQIAHCWQRIDRMSREYYRLLRQVDSAEQRQENEHGR